MSSDPIVVSADTPQIKDLVQSPSSVWQTRFSKATPGRIHYEGGYSYEMTSYHMFKLRGDPLVLMSASQGPIACFHPETAPEKSKVKGEPGATLYRSVKAGNVDVFHGLINQMNAPFKITATNLRDDQHIAFTILNDRGKTVNEISLLQPFHSWTCVGDNSVAHNPQLILDHEEEVKEDGILVPLTVRANNVKPEEVRKKGVQFSIRVTAVTPNPKAEVAQQMFADTHWVTANQIPFLVYKEKVSMIKSSGFTFNSGRGGNRVLESTTERRETNSHMCSGGSARMVASAGTMILSDMSSRIMSGFGAMRGGPRERARDAYDDEDDDDDDSGICLQGLELRSSTLGASSVQMQEQEVVFSRFVVPPTDVNEAVETAFVGKLSHGAAQKRVGVDSEYSFNYDLKSGLAKLHLFVQPTLQFTVKPTGGGASSVVYADDMTKNMQEFLVCYITDATKAMFFTVVPYVSEECVICLGKKPNLVLMPCRHMCIHKPPVEDCITMEGLKMLRTCCLCHATVSSFVDGALLVKAEADTN